MRTAGVIARRLACGSAGIRNQGREACSDAAQRAAPIERSTASLGQQSTLSPADF
jgi:hypothetical protein